MKGGICMNNLFKAANQYVAESDWKDFSLIKLCLCAMGIIIGASLAPAHKRTVVKVAAVVFAVTYVPLMAKFFRIIFRKNNE